MTNGSNSLYIIYTGDNCPRCVEVKQYFNKQNIEYQEINVRQDEAAMSFLKLSGHTSIPQIYRNNKHIASYNNYRDIK